MLASGRYDQFWCNFSKMMSNFFEFESDFVGSLRCIPMQVRYKLDTCGIKLKLSHWHQFSTQERQILVELPCVDSSDISHYRQLLQEWIQSKTGEVAKELPIDPAPPWMDQTQIPTSVQEQGEKVGVVVTLAHWQRLTPLQRFALIKLSRSDHENRNFLPALQEFDIVPGTNSEQ